MATRAEHNRAQYLKNREKRLADQKAYYAANREARCLYNKEYAEKNKGTIFAKRKAYREANSERRKEAMREWYLQNAESVKAKAKEYREANKGRLLVAAKTYRKHRMCVDPVYALAVRTRTLICSKIYTSGYTKRSKTQQILGCSYAEFKAHIEAQFYPGMTWANHGEWHLDHIVPVASAKTEQDVIRLNHYSNFQPLWATDNLKKGAKCVAQ